MSSVSDCEAKYNPCPSGDAIDIEEYDRDPVARIMAECISDEWMKRYIHGTENGLRCLAVRKSFSNLPAWWSAIPAPVITESLGYLLEPEDFDEPQVLELAAPHTPLPELIDMAIAQLREMDMETGPPKTPSAEELSEFYVRYVNAQAAKEPQPDITSPVPGGITVEATATTAVAEVPRPASGGWKAPILQLRERLAEAIRTGNSKLLDGEEIGSLVGMAPDAAWDSFRTELRQAKKDGLDVDIPDLDKRRRMRQAAVEASNIRWNVAHVEKTGNAPALITNATWEIAGIITATSHFAVDPGRRLYVFRDGAYAPHGDAYVKRRVKAILIENKKAQAWQKKKAEEVLEFITVDAPTLWERPPLDVVNVTNGLVDVNSEKLGPHSPGYLSPVQIPVKFDPAAKCPAIDRFVVSTFPEDAVVIAYEIPAWLMTPDTSIQRAVLLTGDGANGKSTYLSLITAFVGRRNCSAVSLHKLEADRFSVARLVGRLANICPDLPGVDLQSTSIFKAITGGDEIQGEYKFRDAFEFTPYARLVFSANSLPRSSDASPAFFRRWLVLPFERRFVEGQNAIPRRELDAMLSDPSELSGLLNKALAKLPGLRDRGFAECASTKQAAEEFRMTTDPLSIWLDHNTVARPDGIVTQDTLCSLYNADCIAKSRPMITKQAFGRALSQARPAVEKKQRMVNRVLTWCYAGIGLITGEEP